MVALFYNRKEQFNVFWILTRILLWCVKLSLEWLNCGDSTFDLLSGDYVNICLYERIRLVKQHFFSVPVPVVASFCVSLCLSKDKLKQIRKSRID